MFLERLNCENIVVIDIEDEYKEIEEELKSIDSFAPINSLEI